MTDHGALPECVGLSAYELLRRWTSVRGPDVWTSASHRLRERARSRPVYECSDTSGVVVVWPVHGPLAHAGA